MKQGQVTLFILIGLALLLVVGFVFFILIQNVNSQGQQQQQAVLEEILTKTSLQQRMELCLNQAVHEGVSLLSRQGGFFVAGQQVSTPYGSLTLTGSSIPFDRTFTHQGSPVTVLVERPALVDPTGRTDASFLAGGNAFLQTPYYPCMSATQGSPLLGIPSLSCTTDINLDGGVCAQDCTRLYRFSTPMKPRRLDPGVTTLRTAFADRISFPPVCKQNYPEGCGDTTPCDCTCEEDCDESVQAQLEDFLHQYYDQCISTATFPGYDLTLDDFTLATQFTKRTYDVSLQQHVEVASSTSSHRFDVPVIHAKQTPLKMIPLLQELTRVHLPQDEENPAYDLQEEIEHSVTFAETVVDTTYVQQGGKLYNLVHIRLQGEDGTLDGNPLVFTFARENRIPVLEGMLPLSPSALPGNRFTVVACGADPDEDQIFYDFVIGASWRPTSISSTQLVDQGRVKTCAQAQFLISNLGLRGTTQPLSVAVKENVPGAEAGNERTFDFQTVPVTIPS